MTHTKDIDTKTTKAAEREALKSVRREARRELCKTTARPWHAEVSAYDITSPTGQYLGGHMTFREALAVERILGADGWRCVARPTAAQKATAKRWELAGIGAN
jgi:hypothetical protein